MKEFQSIFTNTQNKLQLAQLCKDAETEMNIHSRPIFDTLEVFEEYYNLDMSPLELTRLGKFIKNGEYMQVFSKYYSYFK